MRLPVLRPLALLALAALAACSPDSPAPAASVAGAMAPVAGLGRLLTVTATAADKQQTTTVAADAQTGAFAFAALPPGTYTLTFGTSNYAAPQSFPVSVPVTVAAGEAARPAIPPLTHDGVGRGTLRWTQDGQSYTATTFIKVYGDGKFLNFWGRAGSFGAGGAQVSDVELVVPQDFGLPSKQAYPFAGAGTYPLGGPGAIDPFGDCTTYPGNDPYRLVRYGTVGGPATGTLLLTRYDAQQGVATGTFEFKALAQTGVLTAITPPQAVVTGGAFDITF